MMMDEGYSLVKMLHRYCLHHAVIKDANIMHTSAFDGIPQTSMHITFADGTRTQMMIVGPDTSNGIVSEVK